MQLKKQFRPVPYEVAGIQYQIHPFAAMDSVAVCGTLMVLFSAGLAVVRSGDAAVHRLRKGQGRRGHQL